MSHRRFAMIVGTTDFDEKLNKVITRQEDADGAKSLLRDLEAALGDLEKAKFETKLLLDQPADTVMEELMTELADRRTDEFMLLYFYGQAGVDQDGNFLFACSNTKVLGDSPDRYVFTSKLDVENIVRMVSGCAAQTKILIFDCCYTDTITEQKFNELKSNGIVKEIEEAFQESKDIIVISARRFFQEHFKYQKEYSERGRSDFTRYFIEGLTNAEADFNCNGEISVAELFDYVYRKANQQDTYQKPFKWAPDDQEDVILAEVPAREPEDAAPAAAPVQDSDRTQTSSAPECFVVSPFGGKDPALAERAVHVLEHYITPACRRANYKAVRADKQLTPQIMPEVLKSLNESPMVVAYLGAPPWNSNVMIEVGFRMATGSPLVLLRDTPVNGDHEVMPFDLNDYRVIYVPTKDEESTNNAIREQRIENIAQTISTSEKDKKSSWWPSDYPLVQMVFNTKDGDGVFMESTSEADNIFGGADTLKDLKLSDFIFRLQNSMPSSQYQQFAHEQEAIVSSLVKPPLFIKDMPRARTPIIIDQNGSKEFYLPIIVQHKKLGEQLFLKVLYLDVAGAVEETQTNGGDPVFVCSLREFGASERVAQ